MTVLPLMISYFCGSIPFGLLIVRLVKKIDIREYGSRNIGATNVARVVGKKWGILVFILDFLKGFLPFLCLPFFFSDYPKSLFILMALLGVVGHNWSIFLKFGGGKGVSTSLGVIAGLCLGDPCLIIPLLVSLLVWVVVFLITKYVSLASLLAALVFLMVSLIYLDFELKAFAVIIFIFILLRHRNNIKNFIQKKNSGFRQNFLF